MNHILKKTNFGWNCNRLSIIVFILGLLHYTDSNAIPIISEIGIVGGERGVAISLYADAIFQTSCDCKLNKITVTIKNCIYGLPEFIYDKLPPSLPINKIIARENGYSEVEIVIHLKDNVTIPIKSVQKMNQWIALISKEPVQAFTWKTSQYNIEKDSSDKKIQKKDFSSLKNVRFIERGHICELAFEFDKNVMGSIERRNNNVVLLVENSMNSVEKKNLKLPESAAFARVSVTQEDINGKSMLKASFEIDTTDIETDFNIAFTQGEVLSFILTKKQNRKATLWTSGDGLAVDYRFYEVPSYNVDFKNICKRAEHDATIQLSRKKIFSINYENKLKDEVKLTAQQVIDTGKAEYEPDNKIETIKNAVNDLMIVKTDYANIRSKPTQKSQIKGKLSGGDTVEIIKQVKQWSKIARKNDTGFVFSDLLKKNDTVMSEKNNDIVLETTEDANIGNSHIAKVSATKQMEITTESTIKYAEDLYGKIINEKQELPSLRKKIIQYHGNGRDPFQPLISDSILQSEFALVENLKLVGVLIDDIDRVALCEDTHNRKRPFTLRENDPVYKGKVLKIYKDKVVFLMTEYGISRSFTLSIAKTMTDQEASKR